MNNFAPLEMWAIYDSPADFHGKFVARRFLVTGAPEPVPTKDHYVADTLQAVRDALPRGLACITRDPKDEPHIVETWL